MSTIHLESLTHSMFRSQEANFACRLVALIELAEGPFECSHIVVCIDRAITEEERKPLMNGLQWAGFSLTTLDHFTGGMDVTSSKWLFMGMEV